MDRKEKMVIAKEILVILCIQVGFFVGSVILAVTLISVPKETMAVVGLLGGVWFIRRVVRRVNAHDEPRRHSALGSSPRHDGKSS